MAWAAWRSTILSWMKIDAEVLREVLQAAKVSLDQLALLLQVDVKELAAVEQGAAPQAGVFEACARLLGVTLDELFEGRAGPPALLYRSLEGVTPKMETLAEEGAALTIGGYIQDLHKVSLLEDAHETVPAWATFRRIPPESPPWTSGEELALEVRRRQDLGIDPIPTMWGLARELGVRCAAVRSDELSPSITGVSWRGPCLVVNLISDWWRTRTTIAHELCHVLFDLPNLGVIVSGDRHARHHALFADVEQRANSFAARLLVPPEGVRQIVGQRNPIDLGIVRHLSARYQVSTFLACDVLCNTFRVPDLTRRELKDKVRNDHAMAADHPDVVGPPSPRAQLLTAVEAALTSGRIGRVRARTLLGLDMSDPLPFGEDEPLLGLRERIECAVGEHLHRVRRTHLAPTHVEILSDDTFQVTLESAAPGGSCPGERLRLSPGMVVLDASA